MTSSGGTAADRAEPAARVSLWEPYNPFRGAAVLAQYVSPPALRRLRLNAGVPVLTPGVDAATAGRDRARHLFDNLKRQGIAYAIEPWTGNKKQQVRHPWWLVEDRWGTCLDLAVTYGAMCIEARIATMLAIAGEHALVVLEPRRQLTDGPVPEWRRSWASKKADGVFAVDDHVALNVELDEGTLLAVETVAATEEGDFDEALRRGREALGAGAELIDVPFLHMRRFRPLPAPDERPSIRMYVPGGQRSFVRYPSQEKVLDALQEDSGVVVLVAPQGQGKSTIARQLALDAPFGAGWFLNASEPQSLIRSLADADLGERNSTATGMLDAERKGFVEGARERLEQVPGRWVVVLDNADGDPGKITPLLPRPGDGQLVVITTTNSDWEQVPNLSVRQLPPVDDARVAEDLGGDELVSLVAGRALLLHAFASLLDAAGISSAAVARYAPERGEVAEPVRGPATLWAAVRAELALGPDALHSCLQSAYMPPDQQPLEVLEAFNGGARRLVDGLSRAGLVTFEADTGTVRMHRLFGAAVRAELAASEPAMNDEVVLELATNATVLNAFDRYGDQATLMRIDERLTEIDEGRQELDSRLGQALHGVAGLLELGGHTRRSGETYVRAERHLQGRPDLLADVLQSRARMVNQHQARDEVRLREALGWAKEAERTLLSTPGRENTADRCLAMQGLILQKLAAFPGEGDTTIELLHEALGVIEEAHRRREIRLDPMDAELARSEFNLAGPRINLAQLEPERAREHLDVAERVYGRVAERRKKIYDRDVHPHIAACIIGEGYVNYYRALLLPAPPATRASWLRYATERANAALAQRQALDGSVDLDESRKAVRFLAKVALTRAAPAADPARTLESVSGEVSRELAFAAVETLPSHTRDLTVPIKAWLFSPALAAVVAAFGGTPPTATTALDEALAWFEEFSLRWDYRAGKERNLALVQSPAPEVEAVVSKAAPALGLVGTRPPPAEHYDHVLVLGGLVRACMARPLYGAKLLRNETIKAGEVTALGGFRELKGDELDLAAKLGHGGLTNEFDAMDAGVRAAFDVGEPDADRGERSDVVGVSWAVREYQTAAGISVRVVGAPSTEPGVRRANTPDTYAWFASKLAKLRPGERVLVLTSDIYMPYQHADALRMLALPYAVEVDAAGIRPGDAHPDLAQEFKTHNYLQEMRSTIRALRALFGAWQAGD